MSIFKAFISRDLYERLEKYRPTEAQMPWAYQVANPDNRSKHGDWFTLKNTPRIEGARRAPYPQRIKSGLRERKYYPLDPTYPLAPGAIIENRTVQLVTGEVYSVPHILIDDAVDGGGWTVFEAYIDGEWRESCKRYSKMITKFDWESKKFVPAMFKHYQGFKCDTTVVVNPDGSLKSDVLGWIEPPTFSWNRI